MYFFRTFDPDQGGPDLKINVFCQVGAVLVKLCTPSWIYTLGPTQIHPTRTHALVGSIVALVFRVRQIISDRGWATPATISPSLREDHVNNHISRGSPPEHGYANPMSSRGHSSQIRRYRALQPGQLSARSSRRCVFTPDQLSIGSSRRCVFAHGQLSAVSSWGLSLQIRRYRALQPGQLSARSSRGYGCVFTHGQLSAVSSRGLSLCLVQSQPLYPIV